MKPKVLIILNTAWNLYNFRAGLIRALVATGHEVVAVAPPDEYASRLSQLGCRFIPLEMDNKGTHPGRDLMLLMRFVRLFQKERPDVYLGYTVKPNIYGSLAAHALSIPVINNIAGLGAVFTHESWLTRLVRQLYRAALSRSHRVFFQNNDDLESFVNAGLVAREQAARLPGSGIDLRAFKINPDYPLALKPPLTPPCTREEYAGGCPAASQRPSRSQGGRAGLGRLGGVEVDSLLIESSKINDSTDATGKTPPPSFPPPAGEGREPFSHRGKGWEGGVLNNENLNNRPFRFLLVARMLRDKGVVEYVEAARIVRRNYPEAEFDLLGFVDVLNPTAISRTQMEAWVNEGVVNYLGATDDVRPHLAQSDCVVLPSYREGTPRSLLEAAAMGKPIVTTDAVGCRDVVDDGVNGFLCKPKDAGDLADKLLQMIRLPSESRIEMGLRGRNKMEREYDENIVIDRYLAAIKAVVM